MTAGAIGRSAPGSVRWDRTGFGAGDRPRGGACRCPCGLRAAAFRLRLGGLGGLSPALAGLGLPLPVALQPWPFPASALLRPWPFQPRSSCGLGLWDLAFGALPVFRSWAWFAGLHRLTELGPALPIPPWCHRLRSPAGRADGLPALVVPMLRRTFRSTVYGLRRRTATGTGLPVARLPPTGRAVGWRRWGRRASRPRPEVMPKSNAIYVVRVAFDGRENLCNARLGRGSRFGQGLMIRQRMGRTAQTHSRPGHAR